MKRFKVSGAWDAVGFVLYLLVVRYSHWQGPIKVVQSAFLIMGFLYFITVYMIEVRKVRR